MTVSDRQFQRDSYSDCHGSSFIQYTYLLSVPAVMAYAIGFTVIKYQEGFTVLPEYGSELLSLFTPLLSHSTDCKMSRPDAVANVVPTA